MLSVSATSARVRNLEVIADHSGTFAARRMTSRVHPVDNGPCATDSVNTQCMFVLRSMFVLRTFVLRSIFVLRTFVTVVHRGVAMGGVAFSRPSDAKNASSVAGSTNGSGGQGPPSPPARRLALRSRWRDPRLAAGIGLVACSVVAGSWVVASADDRITVWAAARDLASGTEVRVDDLTAVSVRLDAASQYLAASSTEVFGRRVVRSIASGELVPVSAIGTSTTPRRLVTVPVEPMHAPTGLAHGDLVDIYVSPRDAAFDGGKADWSLAMPWWLMRM